MSLANEARRMIVNSTRLALGAVGSGAKTFNEWTESRAQDAANREFDEYIEKAANTAKNEGKDGTHDIMPGGGGGGSGGEPVDRKALHFDPFDLVSAMGYRERPSPLTYQAMERVGRSVPVIADIIQTRTNQVLMFCEQPEGRHEPGFEIRLRNRKTKITKAHEKEIERLTDLMMHCGHYDPEHPESSTTLVDFAKMFIPDSLMYDQATFEVVPDRSGKPSYFAIVDPSTIRLLDPGMRDDGDPFCVQVINGSIHAAFEPGELAFCVRNPRSGIRAYGYGAGEIETLVREITGFLWGMDYNRRFFTQGSATRGILNFKGTIPDKHLRAFRRQWYAMVSGVANSWRTPITNAEELQWINMQMSNRDMEYSAWLDFLIKVCCARYNIAPEEVNFSYGNTGQASAMGNVSVEEKIKASKDLGLRPLVRWFFQCLNVHFLQRIAPEYEIVPVGLSDQGEQSEVELLGKEIGSWMTVDEARERRGYEPLGEENGGNVIENQVWMQWFQSNQMNQMDDEGGGFGDEATEEPGGYEEEEPQIDDSEFDFEQEMNLDEDEAGTPEEPAIKSHRDHRTLGKARYTLDL